MANTTRVPKNLYSVAHTSANARHGMLDMKINTRSQPRVDPTSILTCSNSKRGRGTAGKIRPWNAYFPARLEDVGTFRPVTFPVVSAK